MKLNVKFTENAMSFKANLKGAYKPFGLNFKSNSQTFTSDFKAIQPVTTYVGGDPYLGEYVVTPKVDEQIMETKDKVLTEDIKIKNIPFFDVSNESGGSTVFIGGKI